MDRSYPNVETLVYQDKRQGPLGVGEADPDLAVHQKPMVQVDDSLLDAARTRIDLCVLLAALPGEAVQPQEIAVGGLDDMLLSRVTEQFAELDEIGRVPYGGGYACAGRAWSAGGCRHSVNRDPPLRGCTYSSSSLHSSRLRTANGRTIGARLDRRG